MGKFSYLIGSPEVVFYFFMPTMLQEEVTTYWMRNFEVQSRAILKPEYAANLAVQRPYKWAHLNPTVIDNAISQIWSEGQQWPRYYYDQGHSEDRRVYNWVLKWLLWHVCRYRDWRNRKSKTTTSTSSGTMLTSTTSMGGELLTQFPLSYTC